MGATFIVSVDRRGSNILEDRLQDSRARSHAASIGHLRSRTQRRSCSDKDSQQTRDKYRKIHPVEGKGLEIRNKRPNRLNPEEESLRRYPTPQTMLSQSRRDPFNADSSCNLSTLARECLEHAYLNILPKFDYTLTPSRQAALITHWRTAAVQNPLTLYAHCSNAVSLCYGISPDPRTKAKLLQIRWKHQALAMGIIRERLQALEGPADDDLLENLLRITSQGGDVHEGAFESRYPETPLANGLQLKLYAQFEIGLTHWRFLVELIKGRGGIEQISSNFSSRIVLADVVVSSRFGIRPTFPVLQHMHRFSEEQQFTFDAQEQALFRAMERGWWSSSLMKSHTELALLAIRGALLTAALDQSHRRSQGCLPLIVLCALTTIYQHDLNQTNPESLRHFRPEAHPESIFDVARLGIQVFSSLVLFPLTDGYSSKPRLLKQLRRALLAFRPIAEHEGLNSGQTLDDCADLVLWVTVMGTVLAEGTKDRYWFMRKLIYLLGRMGFDAGAWTVFRGVLVRHLWWDYVFGKHVKDIWLEVWSLDDQDDEVG